MRLPTTSEITMFCDAADRRLSPLKPSEWLDAKLPAVRMMGVPVLRGDASVSSMQVRPQTKRFSNMQSILIVILLQCFSEAATLEVTLV